MSDDKPQLAPDIFPVLRYDDGAKAMEWLTQAFGFSKHMEVPGPEGEVAHAELVLGKGMVMFASAGKPGDGNPWSTERSGVYAVVDDIDAHYQRAVAAGAEIVRPLADTGYGAREYSARDPAGIFGRSGLIVRQPAPVPPDDRLSFPIGVYAGNKRYADTVHARPADNATVNPWLQGPQMRAVVTGVVPSRGRSGHAEPAAYAQPRQPAKAGPQGRPESLRRYWSPDFTGNDHALGATARLQKRAA